MNCKRQLLVFLIFSLAMAPIVSANSLELITTPDTKANGFYVSNYSTREINFKTDFSFKTQELKEGKLVFSYVISPDSKDIDIQFSRTEVNFTNDISSNDVLYITTKKITHIKNIQIRAEVFDNYNNLLFTKVIYIKIIPNNSNNYYEYTKDHSEPRYVGYTLSRSLSVINGKEDYDIISIYTKTQDNSSMAIDCKTSNPAIILEQQYKDYNQTDLKLSISKKAKLESGDYFIDCVIFNASNSQELPQIKLRYTNGTDHLETSKDQSQSISVTEKPKSVTGFLSFSKAKTSNFTSVLFVVLIVLVLFILFSKNGS